MEVGLVAGGDGHGRHIHLQKAAIAKPAPYGRKNLVSRQKEGPPVLMPVRRIPWRTLRLFLWQSGVFLVCPAGVGFPHPPCYEPRQLHTQSQNKRE